MRRESVQRGHVEVRLEAALSRDATTDLEQPAPSEAVGGSEPTGIAQAAPDTITVKTTWLSRRWPIRTQRTGDAGALVLLSILIALMALCFIVPHFTPPATDTNFAPLAPPSGSHPFGTDQLGRNELTLVMNGAQSSIIVGLVVAAFCLLAGALIGGVAGYLGGAVDAVLVKISEFFQVIPPMILALVAAALLGSSTIAVIGILSVCLWPQIARIVRVEAKRISAMGYVESAVAAGFSRRHIFFTDILRNALPAALVAAALTVGRAILWQAALSFIGLGNSNHPDLGTLLSQAQNQLTSGAWWLAVFPGAMIWLFVLLTNLIGDRWNDATNPVIGRVKG